MKKISFIFVCSGDPNFTRIFQFTKEVGQTCWVVNAGKSPICSGTPSSPRESPNQDWGWMRTSVLMHAPSSPGHPWYGWFSQWFQLYICQGSLSCNWIIWCCIRMWSFPILFLITKYRGSTQHYNCFYQPSNSFTPPLTTSKAKPGQGATLEEREVAGCVRKYFFYCFDRIPQPQFSRNRHEEAGKLVLYGRQRDGKFSLQPQVWESTQVVRLEEDVGLRLRTVHHGCQLVRGWDSWGQRGRASWGPRGWASWGQLK